MLCLFGQFKRLQISKNVFTVSVCSHKKYPSSLPGFISKLSFPSQSEQAKTEHLQAVNEEIKQHKARLNELYEEKQKLESEALLVSEKAFQQPWSSTEFPWSEEVQNTLKRTFKLEQLTPIQLQTINATMSKKDVLVVMPTGAGKSLCYQLPALLSSGITVVISPLISLMEDQVLSLKRLGIAAEMIHSQSTLDTLMEVHLELKKVRPNLKLLYVTPERMSNDYFLPQLHTAYRRGNLSRIAIDEVHCVDEWGSSFRPEYKRLNILKQQFPNVPQLGLTATASSNTLMDLKKDLSIPDAVIFTSFYPRKNLYYEVRSKPSSSNQLHQEIIEIIQRHFVEQSGIIYCFSRASCKDMCQKLKESGIKSSTYHSTMSYKERKEAHEKWMSGEISVICATNAFGMGINKNNVRFVIHQSMSKNMETYYQESGRAGRDGLPALCLVYFGFFDVFRNVGLLLSQKMGLKRLDAVIRYCQTTDKCRHQAMAKLFDVETIACEGRCDLCNKNYIYRSCDVSDTCQVLMDFVQSHFDKGRRLTGTQLVKAALKSKLCRHDVNELQIIVMHLLTTGYIKIKPHVYPSRNISYLVPGRSVRNLHRNKIFVRFRDEIRDSISGGLSSD